MSDVQNDNAKTLNVNFSLNKKDIRQLPRIMEIHNTASSIMTAAPTSEDEVKNFWGQVEAAQKGRVRNPTVADFLNQAAVQVAKVQLPDGSGPAARVHDQRRLAFLQGQHIN